MSREHTWSFNTQREALHVRKGNSDADAGRSVAPLGFGAHARDSERTATSSLAVPQPQLRQLAGFTRQLYTAAPTVSHGPSLASAGTPWGAEGAGGIAFGMVTPPTTPRRQSPPHGQSPPATYPTATSGESPASSSNAAIFACPPQNSQSALSLLRSPTLAGRRGASPLSPHHTSPHAHSVVLATPPRQQQQQQQHSTTITTAAAPYASHAVPNGPYGYGTNSAQLGLSPFSALKRSVPSPLAVSSPGGPAISASRPASSVMFGAHTLANPEGVGAFGGGGGTPLRAPAIPLVSGGGALHSRAPFHNTYASAQQSPSRSPLVTRPQSQLLLLSSGTGDAAGFAPVTLHADGVSLYRPFGARSAQGPVGSTSSHHFAAMAAAAVAPLRVLSGEGIVTLDDEAALTFSSKHYGRANGEPAEEADEEDLAPLTAAASLGGRACRQPIAWAGEGGTAVVAVADDVFLIPNSCDGKPPSVPSSEPTAGLHSSARPRRRRPLKVFSTPPAAGGGPSPRPYIACVVASEHLHRGRCSACGSGEQGPSSSPSLSPSWHTADGRCRGRSPNGSRSSGTAPHPHPSFPPLSTQPIVGAGHAVAARPSSSAAALFARIPPPNPSPDTRKAIVSSSNASLHLFSTHVDANNCGLLSVGGEGHGSAAIGFDACAPEERQRTDTCNACKRVPHGTLVVVGLCDGTIHPLLSVSVPDSERERERDVDTEAYNQTIQHLPVISLGRGRSAANLCLWRAGDGEATAKRGSEIVTLLVGTTDGEVLAFLLSFTPTSATEASANDINNSDFPPPILLWRRRPRTAAAEARAGQRRLLRVRREQKRLRLLREAEEEGGNGVFNLSPQSHRVQVMASPSAAAVAAPVNSSLLLSGRAPSSSSGGGGGGGRGPSSSPPLSAAAACSTAGAGGSAAAALALLSAERDAEVAAEISETAQMKEGEQTAPSPLYTFFCRAGSIEEAASSSQGEGSPALTLRRAPFLHSSTALHAGVMQESPSIASGVSGGASAAAGDGAHTANAGEHFAPLPPGRFTMVSAAAGRSAMGESTMTKSESDRRSTAPPLRGFLPPPPPLPLPLPSPPPLFSGALTGEGPDGEAGCSHQPQHDTSLHTPTAALPTSALFGDSDSDSGGGAPSTMHSNAAPSAALRGGPSSGTAGERRRGAEPMPAVTAGVAGTLMSTTVATTGGDSFREPPSAVVPAGATVTPAFLGTPQKQMATRPRLGSAGPPTLAYSHHSQSAGLSYFGSAGGPSSPSRVFAAPPPLSPPPTHPPPRTPLFSSESAVNTSVVPSPAAALRFPPPSPLTSAGTLAAPPPLPPPTTSDPITASGPIGSQPASHQQQQQSFRFPSAPPSPLPFVYTPSASCNATPSSLAAAAPAQTYSLTLAPTTAAAPSVRYSPSVHQGGGRAVHVVPSATLASGSGLGFAPPPPLSGAAVPAFGFASTPLQQSPARAAASVANTSGAVLAATAAAGTAGDATFGGGGLFALRDGLRTPPPMPAARPPSSVIGASRVTPMQRDVEPLYESPPPPPLPIPMLLGGVDGGGGAAEERRHPQAAPPPARLANMLGVSGDFAPNPNTSSVLVVDADVEAEDVGPAVSALAPSPCGRHLAVATADGLTVFLDLLSATTATSTAHAAAEETITEGGGLFGVLGGDRRALVMASGRPTPSLTATPVRQRLRRGVFVSDGAELAGGPSLGHSAAPLLNERSSSGSAIACFPNAAGDAGGGVEVRGPCPPPSAGAVAWCGGGDQTRRYHRRHNDECNGLNDGGDAETIVGGYQLPQLLAFAADAPPRQNQWAPEGLSAAATASLEQPASSGGGAATVLCVRTVGSQFVSASRDTGCPILSITPLSPLRGGLPITRGGMGSVDGSLLPSPRTIEGGRSPIASLTSSPAPRGKRPIDAASIGDGRGEEAHAFVDLLVAHGGPPHISQSQSHSHAAAAAVAHRLVVYRVYIGDCQFIEPVAFFDTGVAVPPERGAGLASAYSPAVFVSATPSGREVMAATGGRDRSLRLWSLRPSPTPSHVSPRDAASQTARGGAVAMRASAQLAYPQHPPSSPPPQQILPRAPSPPPPPSSEAPRRGPSADPTGLGDGGPLVPTATAHTTFETPPLLASSHHQLSPPRHLTSPSAAAAINGSSVAPVPSRSSILFSDVGAFGGGDTLR